MQNRSQTSLGTRIGEVIIGVLIVAIFCTLIYISSPQWFTNLFAGFAPSCSIRVDSATVTVKGWHNDCQQMLAGGYGNFTGLDWSRYGATATSEEAANIQCEFDLAGRHVTVRDEAGSNTGSGLCMLIQGPGH